uniref:Uncharacterized protein n=1 Tax=Rhizophora mucronata TaxID=61149 RepID=A0A2P2QZW9_RHIMU
MNRFLVAGGMLSLFLFMLTYCSNFNL